MRNKIIISGEEKVLRPTVPFSLSLLVTGLGQIYSGSPARAIIYGLARVIPLLSVPLYSLLHEEVPVVDEVTAAIAAFIIISLISPVDAWISAVNKKKIMLKRYNSTACYAAFAAAVTIITALSITIFFSFFSLIHAESFAPLIHRNDIIIVKKITRSRYHRGELIISRNDGRDVLSRIISVSGEKVSFRKGRFVINGSELPLSIFDESQLQEMSLTDTDIISEQNGQYIYPVIQSENKSTQNFTAEGASYFTAPDNRNDITSFKIIPENAIWGRVEGVLYSKESGKIVIPSCMLDNR